MPAPAALVPKAFSTASPSEFFFHEPTSGFFDLEQVSVALSTYTKLGMELDAKTARVTRVDPGGQAEAKAIACGWIVKKVGSTPVR
jgi:hypothetical protein